MANRAAAVLLAPLLHILGIGLLLKGPLILLFFYAVVLIVLARTRQLRDALAALSPKPDPDCGLDPGPAREGFRPRGAQLPGPNWPLAEAGGGGGKWIVTL